MRSWALKGEEHVNISLRPTVELGSEIVFLHPKKLIADVETFRIFLKPHISGAVYLVIQAENTLRTVGHI